MKKTNRIKRVANVIATKVYRNLIPWIIVSYVLIIIQFVINSMYWSGR